MQVGPDRAGIGIVFIYAQAELHLLALNLGLPEVRMLVETAQHATRLNALLKSPAGDMRLSQLRFNDEDVGQTTDFATSLASKGSFPT